MNTRTQKSNKKSTPILVGQGVSDLIAISLSAAFSYVLISTFNNLSGIEYVNFERLLSERFIPFISVTVMTLVYFLTQGHYHMKIPFWEETKAVVISSFIALLVEGFFIYINKADVSRTSVFMTWALMPFFVMWIRASVRRVLGTSKMTKVTVFGDQEQVQRAKLILGSDKHMGILISETSQETDAEKAHKIMLQNASTEAIVALSGANKSEIKLIQDLRFFGVDVSVLPPALGMSSSMHVHYLLGMDAMLLVSKPEITPRLSRLSKRAFDIVVSTIILTALLIPMMLISLVIAMDGKNPIFSHQRVGKNGVKFDCLKFRSMHSNSDEILEKYLSNNPSSKKEWEDNQKLVNDPRITKFGHIIRKTSIDEFPQLINVIKGDMSLIGPRPVTEKELSHYAEHAELYTAVKPGMTGLWQVSGRSNLSYEQRVSLDAWYVNNWSPWHDLIILAKTLPVVIKRSGAH